MSASAVNLDTDESVVQSADDSDDTISESRQTECSHGGLLGDALVRSLTDTDAMIVDDSNHIGPQSSDHSRITKPTAASTKVQSLSSSQASTTKLEKSPFDVYLSKQLRTYKMIHEIARKVQPRMRLAAHRYWIAVLDPGKRATVEREEKDYVWMKGNRLTSIHTVSRIYGQRTADDEFVLLLGFDTTKPQDRMEELDLLNDKLIVLRCIREKDQTKAAGLEITRELIPPQRGKPATFIDLAE